MSQEFTAGSLDGAAARVERGMTETHLTPDQITSIGITAKKERDKFVYTVPTEISWNTLSIPVVSTV